MVASLDATGVGTQLADDLDVHEARAAARHLVTGLFDAWDTGDRRAFLAHFLDDASWTDPGGERSTGRTALGAHFARWRGWEPFSVHWVSNEQVLDDAGELVGTWLWSAASNIDRGATAAWSGGDLYVRFARSGGAWRIAELVVTDRYRTPYHAGWLDHLLVQPDFGDTAAAARPDDRDVVGTALAGVTVPALPTPAAGDAATRLAALEAESEIRMVVGEYSDAVEQGPVDAAVLAEFWTPDGSYESDVVATPAFGTEALVAAHAAETRRASAWIRALMSQSIRVEGDRAQCRWRDIWTAEVGGQARWLAHAYEATVVHTPTGWRIDRLRRHALLDCSYQEGWTRDIAGDNGPAAKETRR